MSDLEYFTKLREREWAETHERQTARILELERELRESLHERLHAPLPENA